MLFVAYYVDYIDNDCKVQSGGGGGSPVTRDDMGMHLATLMIMLMMVCMMMLMHGVHDDVDDIDDIMMIDDADDADDDDDDGDVNDMDVMMWRQMSMICRGCLMWYLLAQPCEAKGNQRNINNNSINNNSIDNNVNIINKLSEAKEQPEKFAQCSSANP